MVRSLTLFVGVLAFTFVGADVDCQADETTLLQGFVSHRGRPTPQLPEVPHKPKPRPLPQLVEVPVPDKLPAKFAIRVNVWANANPGAARVVREATRQQIMQALLDADGGDVEAAVAHFPGAAQAIRQIIQNVDGQDVRVATERFPGAAEAVHQYATANPDTFARLAGVFHEIRAATSVPEIPEQAPGRFADEIREWANANPDAAEVVRGATRRQILQALLDAEKHDVERAAGRFPDAAQAIRQFIQNMDREDVEAASERFPGAAEAIRQYASSHPTDSRRVARFIREIRQSGTTSLLQWKWIQDFQDWYWDLFDPLINSVSSPQPILTPEEEEQQRLERLEKCEANGCPHYCECYGQLGTLNVANIR